MTERRTGRLARVPIRKVWARECPDFAPWLAEPDNLAALGEAVGLQLANPATERRVAGCQADIVCRDAWAGLPVVIEAQLGPSDHGHLGQLVAYATAFDATAAIWIARDFRDVHREAIVRLNLQGGGGVRYYGVELEMWAVDDSLPAPRFVVVAGPGDRPAPAAPETRWRPAPVRVPFGPPGRAARAASRAGG